MNDILKPITPDGNVGYDQFNQLICTRMHPGGDWKVTTHIADMRNKTCRICQQGWKLSAESFHDQFHWSLIDDWVHETCVMRHYALVERAEYERHFIDARVRFKVVEIENGYWGKPDDDCRMGLKPWYRIELTEHPANYFIIGARKRVTSIRVCGPTPWFEVAEKAFADQAVTKDFDPNGVMVHAGSIEKEKEYVRHLVKAGGFQIKDD
jgi:hypothetical protein